VVSSRRATTQQLQGRGFLTDFAVVSSIRRKTLILF
jgi:hypothetical protein